MTVSNSISSDITTNGQISHKIYAGFWVRFFSHIVEIFALIGALILISPTIAIIVFFLDFIFEIQTHHKITDAAMLIISGKNMIMNISCFVIFAFYVIFFVSSDKQSSAGQKIMSIHIGDKEGSRALLVWSIMRFLMNYFPIIILIIFWKMEDSYQEIGWIYLMASGSLAFLAISLLMLVSTKQKISLPDFICGTRVFYGKK
jgi:uncharacterized RDD family membrane protein YckC